MRSAGPGEGPRGARVMLPLAPGSDAARWTLEELRQFLARPLLAAKTLRRATLEVDGHLDTDISTTWRSTSPVPAPAAEAPRGAAYGFVLMSTGRDTGVPRPRGNHYAAAIDNTQ